MKIKSITDIITNSSTEVFTIITDHGIKRVKDLLREVLNLVGDKRGVDEIFTFKVKRDSTYCELIYNEYTGKDDWDDLSESEQEEFINNHYEYDDPTSEYLTITCKDKKYKPLIEQLEGIENFFTHEARYTS